MCYSLTEVQEHLTALRRHLTAAAEAQGCQLVAAGTHPFSHWQELIETLVWAHERTPPANLVRWKDKPVAISIGQGRLVGLAHCTVGYILTYAAFLIVTTVGHFG